MRFQGHGFRSSSLSRLLPLAAIGTLLVGLSAPAAFARDVGALGGNGGGDFRQTCNAGDVLIGLSVRVGKALDQVTATCAKIRNDGRHSTSYSAGTTGGSGGRVAHRLRCVDSQAVKEIRVSLDHGGKIVQGVQVVCVHFKSQAKAVLRHGDYGGKSLGIVPFTCSSSEYASGIYGRSGALIDRLGLQCAKFTPPTQEAPKAPPTDTTKAPNDSPPPLRPIYRTATISGDVDVYRQEHGQGGVLGILRQGDRVRALCKPTIQWCRVLGDAVKRRTNGAEAGYVFMDFVQR